MRKFYLFVLLFIAGSIGQAQAGWPIGKYRHIFTPSVTFYSSKNYWDKQGTKVTTPSGSYFKSVTLGLYGGVGISRRADLFVSVPYSVQSNRFNGDKISTPSGLGDLNVSLAYNLAHWKYKKYLSLQGTVIAPLYTIQSTGNTLGYGVAGGELKMSFCGNLSGNAYFNAEAGYRRYLDDKGPNQIIYTAAVGTALDERKKHQLGADISGVTSYSANRDLISVNPNLVYDGYYVKASVNYGYKFTNRLSLFGSGFYNVAGRNAPIGSGVSVFAIVKF